MAIGAPRFEGLEILAPVTAPSRPPVAIVGEPVEVRPLAAYAELAR